MIKNLKIYSGKKIKKSKLIKTALATTVSLILTACSKINFNNFSNNYNVNENSNSNNSSVSSTYDDLSSSQNYDNISIEFDENLNENLEKNISLEQSKCDEINKFIENINVDFKYSELYCIDENLNKYNEKKKIEYNENYQSKYLSVDNIYEKVKENNKKYLSENLTNKYNEIPDLKLREICNYILESWIKETKESSINLVELDKIVNTLTILEYNDFAYAFYDQSSNMLGVNFNSISTINEDNALQRLITHESKHVLQSINNKYDNNSKNKFGTNIRWDEIKVNSLYNEWFFEASAEALTNDQIGNDGKELYENGLNTINLIKSATIISDKNSVVSLEQLSLQDDLNNLFKYFDCDSMSEKKEILNTFFAYNIINTTSPDSTVQEFYDFFSEKNLKQMDYYEKANYIDELKISSSVVLTKIFYKNLLNYIENNKITMKECFSIMKVFEVELNKHCKYYDETKTEYTKLLLNEYSKIQDELFKAISYNLNIDYSEIKKTYNSFFITEDIEFLNLPPEKIEYYENIYNSDKYFKNYPINAYYGFSNSSNKKK